MKMENDVLSNNQTTYLKQFAKAEVDHGLKQRWSDHLLREARPHIVVDMKYDEKRFAHLASVTIGGIGEHQYVCQSYLDGGITDSGQPNQHPEWMRYHAENMVRMAETGVFFKWFERILPAEHRKAFEKMYTAIKNVQMIPGDSRASQIDESWLAVMHTVSGPYRETLGNIRRDPLVLYAMLTMLQQ